jgi:hypothetical protein
VHSNKAEQGLQADGTITHRVRDAALFAEMLSLPNDGRYAALSAAIAWIMSSSLARRTCGES